MRNVTKLMTGIALLSLAPSGMAAVQNGPAAHYKQQPPYATPALASVQPAPEQQHTSGCGCAACQLNAVAKDTSAV